MRRVTAAILIRDGLVLIAKRKTGDRLAGKWEFPGGTIEDGETYETNGARKKEQYPQRSYVVFPGECRMACGRQHMFYQKRFPH